MLAHRVSNPIWHEGLQATQSHPKATPRPYNGHILGIDSGVQGHPTATPRLHQGYTKAIPRLHQGYTKATPRLYQGYTKATLMRPQCVLKATSKPGTSQVTAGEGSGGLRPSSGAATLESGGNRS